MTPKSPYALSHSEEARLSFPGSFFSAIQKANLQSWLDPMMTDGPSVHRVKEENWDRKHIQNYEKDLTVKIGSGTQKLYKFIVSLSLFPSTYI